MTLYLPDHTTADTDLLEASVTRFASRSTLCSHTFVLPLPPSLNNQYIDRIVEGTDGEGKPYLYVRRFKSMQLMQFELDAQSILAYRYRITPHAPWTNKDAEIGYRALVVVPTWASDLGNRMKAALDVLADVFGFNDNRVVDEHPLKMVGRPPRLIIHLYVLEPASTLSPPKKRERTRKALVVL